MIHMLHLLLNITSLHWRKLLTVSTQSSLLSAHEEQKLSCHLSAGEDLEGPSWLSSHLSFLTYIPHIEILSLQNIFHIQLLECDDHPFPFSCLDRCGPFLILSWASAFFFNSHSLYVSQKGKASAFLSIMSVYLCALSLPLMSFFPISLIFMLVTMTVFFCIFSEIFQHGSFIKPSLAFVIH